MVCSSFERQLRRRTGPLHRHAEGLRQIAGARLHQEGGAEEDPHTLQEQQLSLIEGAQQVAQAADRKEQQADQADGGEDDQQEGDAGDIVGEQRLPR